jgi:hypothetical protein
MTAFGLAVLTLLLVWVFQNLWFAVFRAATGKEQPRETYGPFGNPITLGILMLCAGLMATGLYIVLVRLSFTGVWIGFAGYYLWWAGDTDIPTEPQHAGTLMLNGDYIIMFGSPVVVGGRTIVFPYWPIRLTVKTFDMTMQDYEIEMIIYVMDNSRNPLKKVPLYGKVSVALRPNKKQLIEYNLAGGMKNIKAQVDDIVVRETRHVAINFTADDVVTNPTTLSAMFEENGRIRRKVEGFFEGRSFGVELLKFQPHFDYSEELREEMEAHQAELFQRFAELEEIETDVQAAEKLIAGHRRHGNHSITFAQALEQYKQLRLIREGMTYSISGTGATIAELPRGGKKNRRGNP